MSRIHPECPNSDPPDRSVAADVLVREEPDEDDDDAEETAKKKRRRRRRGLLGVSVPLFISVSEG